MLLWKKNIRQEREPASTAKNTTRDCLYSDASMYRCAPEKITVCMPEESKVSQ